MTIHLPKVNQFGGGNGGGGDSSSFPVTVTSSGSSLPATTGFSAGDTFLNTSGKKIYTAKPDGYELNTNVQNNRFSSQGSSYGSYVTINQYTGIASGFVCSVSYGVTEFNYLSRGSLPDLRWKGEKEYKVHFKITSNPSGWYNLFFISNTIGYASYGDNADVITVGIYNGKLYIQAYHITSSMGSGTYTTIKARTEILDTTIQNNTEYYLTIKKKDSAGTIEVSISSTSYIENIIETKTTETGISDVADYSNNQTYFYYSFIFPYSSSYTSSFISAYGSGFTIGEIYLLDSTGEILKDNSVLSWEDEIDLEDEKQYIDITNGALYFYKDDTLMSVPKLPEKIEIDSATISISNIKENTNYIFSNSAITSITFSACDTSLLETTIQFSTGNSVPTFVDNSEIIWMDGFIPASSLQANKSYLMVIFNKLGFVKEY